MDDHPVRPAGLPRITIVVFGPHLRVRIPRRLETGGLTRIIYELRKNTDIIPCPAVQPSHRTDVGDAKTIYCEKNF